MDTHISRLGVQVNNSILAVKQEKILEILVHQLIHFGGKSIIGKYMTFINSDTIYSKQILGVVIIHCVHNYWV